MLLEVTIGTYCACNGNFLNPSKPKQVVNPIEANTAGQDRREQKTLSFRLTNWIVSLMLLLTL